MDAEGNGQPDSTATGDDLIGSPNDEDGVVFSGSLLPSFATNITVTSSGNGLLDAWVDFNVDGDWNDSGEQVFTNQSVSATANPLVINTPAGATLGDTFARFRLSTAGGLSPDGAALDGEVEDYQIEIVPAADLSITKDDGVVTAAPGDVLTYTITVSNSGPSAVTGATVSDVFPDALTGVTWTASGTAGTNFTASGSDDISELVDIPAAGSITYTVTVDAAARDIISNGATVIAPLGISDPDLTNNSDGDGDVVFLAGAVSSAFFADGGQNLGSSRSHGVSLGDLDGDGDLDAFVANRYQANKVWINDGSGTFNDSGQNLGSSRSLGVSLVPQLTIVTPPKPKFHYFVACLPIVPSNWQGV